MESVVRGAAIYVVMLIVIRLSGRRTLAQMRPFDLVLILIVSETTQQALLGEDFSVINALVLILTLFTLDIALSYIKRAAPWFSDVLDGRPTVLVVDGRPDKPVMDRARVAVSDVLEVARAQRGLTRLSQIRYAILEPSGDISIIPAPSQGD